MRRGWSVAVAAAVLWIARLSGQPEKRPPGSHAIEIPMSGTSPFDPSCAGQQIGTLVSNTSVEPYVASDPNRPEHLVGVWQQDRWTNGGASGLLAAVTTDGGWNWRASAPRFTRCTGGAWDRASDPWVAVAVDGTVFDVALGLNGVGATGQSNSVLVARSGDGGLTWSDPATIIQDTDGAEDKESVTADATDARCVYVVWDRPNGPSRQPALFSRTTDGGATWEPARAIFDPGANQYTLGNIIAALPDGTLVDVMGLYQGQQRSVAAIRSLDRGVTWSGAVTVANNQSVGTTDTKTRTTVRVGAGLPAVAVDRTSGALYVAWQDARFSGGRLDGIALSKSTDGGLTWSPPQQVNQAPVFQAFTPAVAVGADGRVAVTYYDFRNDTPDASVLLTNRWQAVSRDGGATWRETPVGATFDLMKAPAVTGGALFVGDYQGLAASGNAFVSFASVAGAPTAVWGVPVRLRP